MLLMALVGYLLAGMWGAFVAVALLVMIFVVSGGK